MKQTRRTKQLRKVNVQELYETRAKARGKNSPESQRGIIENYANLSFIDLVDFEKALEMRKSYSRTQSNSGLVNWVA